MHYVGNGNSVTLTSDDLSRAEANERNFRDVVGEKKTPHKRCIDLVIAVIHRRQIKSIFGCDRNFKSRNFVIDRKPRDV